MPNLLKRLIPWIVSAVLFAGLMCAVMRAEPPASTVTATTDPVPGPVPIKLSGSGILSPLPILTPSDREPVHLALEALITAQAQLIQLQAQMSELQKTYQSELDKLKSECIKRGGIGELIQEKDKTLNCAPKPATPPVKPTAKKP